MNKSVLTILLALTAASTCVSAQGANVYESHVDIYRSLSQRDEAFNSRPATALKRVMHEKKAVPRARARKDRMKIATRSQY